MYPDLFQAKRVGLITNPTGMNTRFESTIDIFARQTNLVALFSPEHGIRGDKEAGLHVGSYVDHRTGIKVSSLYGETRRPTKEMMDSFDILAFDIQDVGARFYTYLYTMAYAMTACKEEMKTMVVFDRPNPVNASDVEGNLLDIDYRSFVGYYPIPQRYGLTIGELAILFNQEFGIGSDLVVVPMEGYDRKMDFSQTGLPWISPSPNIPSVTTPYYYLATCIFEGTNLSEGRGTTKPFQMIGSPYLDNEYLIERLKAAKLEGVAFIPAYFTPTFSKHKDHFCFGIELVITDRQAFQPVKTGYVLLDLIRSRHPEFDFIPPFTKGGRPFIDLLTGSEKLRENKLPLTEILASQMLDQQQFSKFKRRYHLYD